MFDTPRTLTAFFFIIISILSIYGLKMLLAKRKSRLNEELEGMLLSLENAEASDRLEASKEQVISELTAGIRRLEHEVGISRKQVKFRSSRLCVLVPYHYACFILFFAAIVEPFLH